VVERLASLVKIASLESQSLELFPDSVEAVAGAEQYALSSGELSSCTLLQI
jgi:hypothetical protein